MTRRWTDDLADEVTPKAVWLDRRRLLGTGGAMAGLTAAGLPRRARAQEGEGLVPSTLEEITTYNNFYEFGPDKGDPAEHAPAMEVRPWSVEVAGLVDRPGTYSPDELLGGVGELRAHLPPALRRGVVAGDPLDGRAALRRAG